MSSPMLPAGTAGGGGARYHGLAPVRILDTRLGQGAPATKIGSGATLPLQVTGRGGVPTSGVSAVVLNVTVTEPTAESWLVAWPAGAPRPLASNLNYVAGQTAPNLVMLKVGDGGKVHLLNSAGSTHVIADVAGWYGEEGAAGGAGYAPLVSDRILDTRIALGAPATRLGPGATLALQVTERGGVPPQWRHSRGPQRDRRRPHGRELPHGLAHRGGRPVASNLNHVAGQIVPNLVVVSVGDGGKVNMFNNAGSTHVVVDVAGWYPG